MIEDRVRAMLRERAEDIDAVPPGLLDTSAPHRSRTPWPVAVAAAAVVLLVAGIVLAVRGTGQHDAAAPAGSCTTELPAQWREAFHSDTPPIPHGEGVLAVTRRGIGVRAVYNLGITVYTMGPDSQELVRFDSDDDVTGAAVGRDSVMVALVSTAPGAIGSTAPPSSGTPPPPNPSRTVTTREIDVFDATTGAKTVVATADATHVIGDVAVLGDTVYYDVHPNATSDAGTVQAYLVPKDVHSVEDSGPDIGSVQSTALHVYWNHGSVEADLPSNVRNALTDDAVTDGQAFATVGDGGIVWADRDGTVRGPFEQHVTATPIIVGVAGPYVFFHDYDDSDELYVLDSRTGAIADTGIEHSGPIPAGGGYVALSNPARRVDTNDLPGLHC